MIYVHTKNIRVSSGNTDVHIMLATTTEELEYACDQHGIRRRHIAARGLAGEAVMITAEQKSSAITAGAREIDSQQLRNLFMLKRSRTPRSSVLGGSR